ncbi:MOSC domain-containing protein [Mucilaginibacter jinjuensis]|uniref:MOSC domain-containing protein n=1 Tax=Mucilaginibacter jinjuensis TaxID=1176721 RepID=A0ABY7T870_9SPHI|nr:MOSC N-terminal beta barrel domain-containing protein [Mucilaginibacter jinjuensis]WCT12468.1 MOSC domain-containing protein [Mucilaginibacter jinjuensis]
MLQVSQLFIYPIKSLGGIELSSAEVTDRGLKYDRRWMLIDDNNRFISQREFAKMALLHINIDAGGLRVTYMPHQSSILIPFHPQTNTVIQATVWDDTCEGTLVDPEVDQWFTQILGMNARLIYMADSSLRAVDPKYAKQQEVTSFADAYPFLIIGQASLDELNTRLQNQIKMDRFRPNIVFTGGEPYAEDVMPHIRINNINFYGVKRCARCVMITIDQQNAAKNVEPMKVLAGYRAQNNKIYFGQNLLHQGVGEISVGDKLEIPG